MLCRLAAVHRATSDFFGVPVVQAARLCGAAEGGEILCTELVRLLGGSRLTAGFEPVGELELKGLDEPVPAQRVVWAPAASDELPRAGWPTPCHRPSPAATPSTS